MPFLETKLSRIEKVISGKIRVQLIMTIPFEYLAYCR